MRGGVGVRVALRLVAGVALGALGCGGTESGTPGGTAASGGTSPGSAGAMSSGGAGSGGTAATGGSAASGGASASGGAGASGRAGTGGSAGGAGMGANAGSESVGTIQIYRLLAAGDISRATATFALVEQAAWDALASGPSSCTSQTFGDCGVSVCPPPDDVEPAVDAGTLPSLVRHHAGTLSVSSNNSDFTATGTPGGENNDYQLTTGNSIIGGEIVTITTTGGTIGAFEATLEIPLAPLLISPVGILVDGGPEAAVSVSRGADLSLTWQARGATQALLAQIIVSSSESATTLGCRFDAARGTGTIPAAALAFVPSGDEIHLFATNTTTVSTPQGPVTLFGALEIASEDKMYYPYLVLE